MEQKASADEEVRRQSKWVGGGRHHNEKTSFVTVRVKEKLQKNGEDGARKEGGVTLGCGRCFG